MLCGDCGKTRQKRRYPTSQRNALLRPMPVQRGENKERGVAKSGKVHLVKRCQVVQVVQARPDVLVIASQQHVGVIRPLTVMMDERGEKIHSTTKHHNMRQEWHDSGVQNGQSPSAHPATTARRPSKFTPVVQGRLKCGPPICPGAPGASSRA